MRKALDLLYRLSGWAAQLLLVSILVLILLQMTSRLLLKDVPGIDEYAGYALAGTSFLALASSFRAGAHIRVSLLINRFGPTLGRVCDLWSLLVAFALVCYFLWACSDFVLDSWRFNELATGMVPTPLWIPRLALPLGLLVLAVALIDEFVRVLRGGRIKEGAEA